MVYEKLTENRRIKTISIDAPWGMVKSLLKDVLVQKLEEKEIKAFAINLFYNFENNNYNFFHH